VRTEKVWFNFTPDRVHWARYAGRDHTHRQTIKRRAETWARRYAVAIRTPSLAVYVDSLRQELSHSPSNRGGEKNLAKETPFPTPDLIWPNMHRKLIPNRMIGSRPFWMSYALNSSFRCV